jgi:hypothetical protein
MKRLIFLLLIATSGCAHIPPADSTPDNRDGATDRIQGMMENKKNLQNAFEKNLNNNSFLFFFQSFHFN